MADVTVSKKFYRFASQVSILDLVNLSGSIFLFYPMLIEVTHNVWHAQHAFSVSGVPSTSRMTVIRLDDGALWVHSPIPVGDAMLAQLSAIGPVGYVIAPSKTHHLFVNDFMVHFPRAEVFGAPGLAEKRPDIRNLHSLLQEPTPWASEIDGLVFDGIPFANESVWFHRASRTLILTDLCQWWQGNLPWQAKLWSFLMGIRSELNVGRNVRLLVRDKRAAHNSAQTILRWPFNRVIVAHNCIVEHHAHEAVAHAFRHFP